MEDFSKHDEDRKRIRARLLINDAEHFKLFGKHNREYQMMLVEDENSKY